MPTTFDFIGNERTKAANKYANDKMGIALVGYDWSWVDEDPNKWEVRNITLNSGKIFMRITITFKSGSTQIIDHEIVQSM